MPAAVEGPFFNDEFGDTFGIIYAFTSDGYSYAELHDKVEDIRRELLRVPDVGKVDILGDQDEKIYIEMSHKKLATLGIDPLQIFAVLQNQNAMVPAGSFETGADRIYLRVSGDFKSVESIREIGIQANGRLFRLGDIANVYRGYVDPPVLKFRYRGARSARDLRCRCARAATSSRSARRSMREMARIKADLPVGIEVHQVADQPKVVGALGQRIHAHARRGGGHRAGGELPQPRALRTGVVVALCIPLVLALDVLADVQCSASTCSASRSVRSSSALGLLVDDAIIAVEMMAIKMEQGWDRVRAAASPTRRRRPRC